MSVSLFVFSFSGCLYLFLFFLSVLWPSLAVLLLSNIFTCSSPAWFEKKRYWSENIAVILYEPGLHVTRDMGALLSIAVSRSFLVLLKEPWTWRRGAIGKSSCLIFTCLDKCQAVW